MADVVAPGDQDKLAQLFGGRLGTSQFAMAGDDGSGGIGGPPMPNYPAAGAPAASNPASRVSDDPAVTAAPQATSPQPGAAPRLVPPTPPTFQSPDLGRFRGLQDRLDQASQPINRADYKPNIWQRILSPVVAAGTGATEGASKGAAAGRGILDQNYNRALESQKNALDPLYKQMDAEERARGYTRDANENAQRGFEDQNQAYNDFERQQEANNTQGIRAPRITTDKDGTEHFFYQTKGGTEYEGLPPAGYMNAKERAEVDKNTPAVGARPEPDPDNKGSLRVKTKAGGYIPYVPKTIDEGALLGDERATTLYNKAHRGTEDKPATKAQFAEVEAAKAKAIAKAHATFAKETTELQGAINDPKHQWTPEETAAIKAAHDHYDQSMSDAQDAYESGVRTLGGTVSGGSATPKPAAAASGNRTAVPDAVIAAYAKAKGISVEKARQIASQSKKYAVQSNGGQ